MSLIEEEIKEGVDALEVIGASSGFEKQQLSTCHLRLTVVDYVLHKVIIMMTKVSCRKLSHLLDTII